MSSQNPYESPKTNADSSAYADSTDRLPKVAKGQKLVINAILAYFLLSALNGAGVLGNILILLVVLVILIVSLWGVVLLVINLNYSIVMGVVVVLLMFLPLINWITLLILNAQATSALRAGGYKVGFMGAKPPTD